MRKLITRLIMAVPLLALVLSCTLATAQIRYAPAAATGVSDFVLSVQNFTQPTTNKIEFDVYLLDADATEPFELASLQFGMMLNAGVYTGGTISAVINNSTSGLIAAQQFAAAVTFVNPIASLPGQTLMRLAGKVPPGAGGGTIISQTGFGTLLTHFVLTSSVNFPAESTLNLIFNSNTVITPLYATRVAQYVGTVNTQLAVTPLVNAIVCCNPPLNHVEGTLPLPFAVTGDGAYCQGAGGLPVGLAGSELNVTYTLSPGGATAAGTGAAITFGNQLAGTYTVNGTNTTGTTAMTGNAVITETPVSTVEVTASNCDSYTWALNGVTYTASGDYTYVVGCVTNILHLTITPSSTVEVTASNCDTYTWALNGVTYTASGDYTYVVGCVTNILHLTITASSTVEATASACDTYTWALNGVTYTASGDYTYVVGCVTNILHLTITASSTVEATEAACDTYTWALNGVTYTASGDYTYVVGCVTNILHLTITPSSTVEQTASNCDSYTWALNGVTYTASGDYTYVVGCVTNILHLTITPSGTNEYTASACDSYTWGLNGVTYTASGDYTYVNVCATNILHLTITPSSTVEVTESACVSYTWALNGVTYTSSGDYTYVVGCVTNILHLTINALVSPVFTQLGPYFQGATPAALPLTSLNGITGTWSPAVISTATVGTAVYTFTPGVGQCANGAIMSVVTNALPVAVSAVWNGSVSGSWFTDANWTTTPAVAVLGATTTITIPGGVLPNYLTLSAPATCASITINNGGSFIGAEFLTVGTATVKRDIVPIQYHYLSSPIASATFGNVFSGSLTTWAKKWNPLTNAWVWQTSLNTFGVGVGSAVTTTSPITANFVGQLNKVDATSTLSNANGGWNLLGNPFQSAIDWDNVVKGAGVAAAVKVWTGANYIDWNGSVGGLAGGIIPAENGFFVTTTVNNDFLTVPLTARVHSATPFFKESVSNVLELQANGNNESDQMFVHFNNDATAAYDNQFDARKLFGEAYAPQLYSIISNDVLAINELPIAGNEVIDLGFSCNTNGEYSFTASGMESFDVSTPIFIEDTKLNTTQDLRSTPVYNFSYVAGENVNRFKLHFKSTTGINDPSNSGISVYSYDHNVIINNTTSLAGEVSVYDMAGRLLIHTNMNSSMKTSIPMQVAIGAYMVKVVTAKASVNHKVFIR